MSAKTIAGAIAAVATVVGLAVVGNRMTAPPSGTAPSATAFPVPDSTYHWPGEIAVDSATRALIPGWQNGDTSVAPGVYLCEVATKMPGYHRVLLSTVNSPVDADYHQACVLAFDQWNDLEASSHGRWPKP